MCVVGAGAAGLFAAIHAARVLRTQGREGRVIAVDGAKKIGAKILVAGGGRCNVTHHVVDEQQYAGTSRPAIRKVLGRFGVERTVAFFAELGVELKQEETGKLFPVSDDAQTVLDALLTALKQANAELWHPWRVASIRRCDAGFVVTTSSESQHARVIVAKRVVLAPGGMALPRTGSDGGGYAIAKALGHTQTAEIFPALVPLRVQSHHWIPELSGVSLRATLSVRVPKHELKFPLQENALTQLASVKPLQSFTNSVLLTHFGLSGPAALDISRYWTASQVQTAAAHKGVLCINWLPDVAEATLDETLAKGGKRTLKRLLIELSLPERIASAVLRAVGVDADQTAQGLSRQQRTAIVREVLCCVVPVEGDRGFTFAEVTAGGVPLTEIKLDAMESRVCNGLHLCGEVLDVDGRVGGFNFQWAWASGFAAGQGAALGLLEAS